MAQIKEEKKRKKKKVSSHRVFGVETIGSPRQNALKMRNGENIGGGFNASPTQTKRSTLKMGSANLGIDQQPSKKVKREGFKSLQSVTKRNSSDKVTIPNRDEYSPKSPKHVNALTKDAQTNIVIKYSASG